jgi:hypothetical protein
LKLRSFTNKEMSQLQPALTFNGTNNYIEVPYSEKLNSKIFTLSCWAKPTKTSTGEDDGLLCAGYVKQGVNKGYFFGKRANNKWDFSLVGGYLQIGSPSDIGINTWVHLAVTFDGSQGKFYLNGQVASQGKTTKDYAVNTELSLYIGAAHFTETTVPHYFFTGQIAEVSIWNKARTQQEIQSDMNKRLTGKEQGLVGYWPLNEGSGNTAIDKTGNGNNGIIKGGATWKQEELALNPAEPITGEFQIPTNSSTGVEFTNKLTTDISYKFTPSGTWKPQSEVPECNAAGLKGFSPEIQTPLSAGLAPYQQHLKYPNNTFFALLAVDKTTGAVTEVGKETTIVLKPGQTLTFVVNDFPTAYENNTGTLAVKWSAS